MKKPEIKSFISNIVNKDYKKAHNFLQQAVEEKLKERVKLATGQKKELN